MDFSILHLTLLLAIISVLHTTIFAQVITMEHSKNPKIQVDPSSTHPHDIFFNLSVQQLRSWPDIHQAWSTFKRIYEKVYNTVAEEEKRLQIWIGNLAHIQMHNYGKNTTFTMAMNEFGDMTGKEFVAERNGYDYKKKLEITRKAAVYMPSLLTLVDDQDKLPENVDWRDHGYVTEVKNQGQCGSCWSFSTTGSLEGQMKRKTGTLPSLSEQNLIDCSKREGNNGCNGGLMDFGFQYIEDQDGIDSESSYPYEMRDDKSCRYKKSNKVADDIGYVDVPRGSEKALKDALANIGPVSVAIDASNRSFQFYREGIYYEKHCDSDALDHGVLAVGYGVDDDASDHDKKHGYNKYWIVKNSWSPSWGEKGFIKMARDRNNHCGIATAASYPLV